MATDLIERGARGSITLSTRRTPVYKMVDVLVCGGGVAGVCAAVAAARAGANTLLVERNVVLGGNAPLSFTIDLPVATGGIGKEIEARLMASGDAGIDAATGGLVYEPEALKYVLLDLAQEAGVQLLLSSWVSTPIFEGAKVRGAMVENKSGRFAIPAKTVIDATGDGEFALRAGADVREHDGATSMQLCFRVGEVDVAEALSGAGDWPDLVAQSKREGRLSSEQPDEIRVYGLTDVGRRRNILYVQGPVMVGAGGWTPDEASRVEGKARALVREYLQFLKNVRGFHKAILIDLAGAMRAPRMRHIVGKVEMAVTPADGLPEACFRPKGVTNLIVTGRAVSIEPAGWTEYCADMSGATLGERAGEIAARDIIDASR